MNRRTIHYSGHVQGVGFRYTAQALAKGFAVTGYVCNLPDGRVRLVAEGEDAEIDALLARVREAMSGHIDRADEQSAAATGEFTGFKVLQ